METQEIRVEAVHAVAGCREAFDSGRTRSLQWRQDQLDGLMLMLKREEKRLHQALATDLGRSRVESVIGDLGPIRAEARYARRHVKKWMQPRKRLLPINHQPGSAAVHHDPRGTVLIVAAWNYPVMLALGPMVAAVAAGNAVVIKPSELAPATSQLLAELVPAYLDPGAIRVVEGEAEMTQSLLRAGVDHVVFTGSAGVGRQVMATAAENLVGVTLELGGKNPCLVLDDADLEVAARRIAWVKLLNGGQTCLAPDYVSVDAERAEEFVALVRDNLESFTSDRRGHVRVRSSREVARAEELLAASQGTVVGDLAAEGEALQPVLVLDPDPDEPLMSEEIFAPILPVVRHRDLDEALATVGRNPDPLAAYAFTESDENAARCAAEITAGAVVINHLAMHFMVPSLPFGGVGSSGMGRYHGEAGFRELTNAKAVLKKPSRPDPTFVYPPYSKVAETLIRRAT